MIKETWLEPRLVPWALKRDYSGRKFKVRITEEVTLSGTYWSGGSRSTWAAVDLSNGDAVPIAQNSAPSLFGLDYDGAQVKLKPGYALREHSIFCGKDSGLTFYIHPENAALLLPPPAEELTPAEHCLLEATASLKASYNGTRPRLQMMARNGFTRDAIEAAKESLQRKGYLNKAGAITVAGRNARPARHDFKTY